MNRRTHTQDDEAEIGASAPSSVGPPLGGSVIPFPLELRAAACALEDDASSLDEDVHPLGLLAVKLVTEWNDVRIRVFCVEQDPD